MIMSVAAIAVTFVCCSEDIQKDIASGEKVMMKFTAKGDEVFTHTVLTENNKVEWQNGDKISLFDPGSNNNEFITSESGASVIFTGEAVDAEGDYYALYPFDNGAKNENGNITTSLPSRQAAFSGSFSTMLNPSVAKAGTDNTLIFKNTCALIKFSLEAGNNVHSVKFRGNNNEPLAGNIFINVNASDHPQASVLSDEESNTEIELTGDFSNGGNFYFVATPAVLSKGLTLVLYDEKGYEWERVGTNETSLVAGKILNLGKISPGDFQPAEDGYSFVNGIYHIFTTKGLVNWANLDNCINSNAILENDIDMAGEEWSPIGNKDAGYNGDFNGNKKVISNLSINNSSNDIIGFFGALAGGAKVHDVIFRQAKVTGTNTSYTGVICGISLGIIEDCSVNESEIYGSFAGAIAGNNSLQITNCNATDIVVKASSSGHAGGISGFNYGKIEACKVEGNSNISTTGSSSCAGGIVGANSQGSGIETSGRIFKCSVKGISVNGSFAGGIAGDNGFGLIAQCNVQGSTSISSDNIDTSKSKRLGGIVGYNSNGHIVACYSVDCNIGKDNISFQAMGGICGQSNRGNIYGCYALGTSFYGNVTGDESGKGAIAGYSSSSITSCYAVLPIGIEGIGLAGENKGSLECCVEIGGNDYSILNTANDLEIDGRKWVARNIWIINETEYPTINSEYMGE